MHQLPERRIVFNLGVYIQDMRFVPKQCAGFSDRSINVIDRVAIAQHIMLRDEDDIGLVQLFIFIAGFGHIGVEQAAVVPGAFHTSAFVVALHLDIIDAVRFIHSQNIQPHGASL